MTRNEILATGAQAIAVSDCGLGSAWPAAVFRWEEHEENRPRGYLGFPSCGPDYTRAAYDSKLIRYYEDRTRLTAAVGVPDDGLTPPTVASMTRCGVDLLGMDFLRPADGRLEAAVWSWARKQTGGPQPVRRPTRNREAGRCALVHAAERDRPAARRLPQGRTLGHRRGSPCIQGRAGLPTQGRPLLGAAERLRCPATAPGDAARGRRRLVARYRRGPDGWAALDVVRRLALGKAVDDPVEAEANTSSPPIAALAASRASVSSLGGIRRVEASDRGSRRRAV